MSAAAQNHRPDQKSTRGFFPRLTKGLRRKAAKQRDAHRELRMEGLEDRQLFSVSQLWFSGNTLVVKTDNDSTSVTVSTTGSNVRINDLSTNRHWDYQINKVGRVEFQGGAGNDKFVNNINNMPVSAYGGAGNDYLEGYNAADYLQGDGGNDTLVGYGGGDVMFGGQGNDTLLGGAGDDQLVGDTGNDNLNGQAGADKLWGGDGADVLISIDGAFGDYVEGGAGADALWVDRVGSSTDRVYGAESKDLVQNVGSFANGADRTLDGDNIADPTDSKAKVRYANDMTTGNGVGTHPLFSSNGPSMNDVKQGNVGDCWLLAGLGAVSLDNPTALRQNVVDFNDGTYGVRLGDKFYRVDNELPVWNKDGGATAGNTRYASLGAQNSMWVAIVEKAFASYRTGANTYDSLNGGWCVEVNKAFRSTSAGEKNISSYSSATALVNDIAARWGAYQAVTIGFYTNNGAPIVKSHAYTIAGIIRNAAGAITGIRIRNPWGIDGAGNDGSNDGYVTLTPAQLYRQSGTVWYGRV